MTTATADPIRVRPGDRYWVQDCDECHELAQCFRTGRDRRAGDRIKPELMCESCIAKKSTDEDPFGVMEEDVDTSNRSERCIIETDVRRRTAI